MSTKKQKLTAAIARAVLAGELELAARLRLDLRVEKAAEAIRDAVQAHPPLTEEHLAYLRSMIPASEVRAS